MAKLRTAFLICVSLFAAFALPVICRAQQRAGPKPVKAAICDILKNPGAYNHKLLEVTGFVARGFEHSSLFDPACSSDSNIWVDLGGKMYCCGFEAKHARPRTLVVEGITVPIVIDKVYNQFDSALAPSPYGAVVRASLVGRFFSGKKTKYPNGDEAWAGFGHLGMSSLFAIQRVLSVDVSNDPRLDSVASVERPTRESDGCDGYSNVSDEMLAELIDQQKKADIGGRAWSLDDPKRVAAEVVTKYAKTADTKPFVLKEAVKKENRIVYRWTSDLDGTRVMIVVHRPYWLSFYARDPAKTAWVVAAVYSC